MQAVVYNSSMVGLGLVIRDSSGFVLAAGSVCLRVNFPPQVVEAAAILYGIRFACDSSLALVHVESDLLSVINIRRNWFIPFSDLGLIISNILQIDCLSNVLSFSLFLE
ncbi:hypothetical protein ACOSP7_019387 [Xanthoceras sorbifolium]